MSTTIFKKNENFISPVKSMVSAGALLAHCGKPVGAWSVGPWLLARVVGKTHGRASYGLEHGPAGLS